MDTISEPICYLCGSTDCTKIHDKIRYNLDPPRPYRCNHCGFTFLHPRMNASREKEFYEQEYRAKYENQSPDEIWEASIPESDQRIERFVNFITEDSSILEIGCSTGYFLHALKDHVKLVNGVELTKECVEFARAQDIPVVESLAEVPDNTYDLVFMFHVLEHIDDPIGFLEEVKKKMKVGGYLIIEVPNVDDVLVSIYRIKNHLDFYWEVAHNFYFSTKSLGEVLETAGFDSTIYPLQRYDLSNHMFWMLFGKPGGKGFFNHIFSQELIEEYAKTLKDRFICDTIIAVAQKQD